jgi:hypothetical protein
MKTRHIKKEKIRDDNERDGETAESRKGNNETASGLAGLVTKIRCSLH